MIICALKFFKGLNCAICDVWHHHLTYYFSNFFSDKYNKVNWKIYFKILLTILCEYTNIIIKVFRNIGNLNLQRSHILLYQLKDL